jgi:hypothetical protein
VPARAYKATFQEGVACRLQVLGYKGAWFPRYQLSLRTGRDVAHSLRELRQIKN